jgi:hypothetical protein
LIKVHKTNQKYKIQVRPQPHKHQTLLRPKNLAFELLFIIWRVFENLNKIWIKLFYFVRYLNTFFLKKNPVFINFIALKIVLRIDEILLEIKWSTPPKSLFK